MHLRCQVGSQKVLGVPIRCLGGLFGVSRVIWGSGVRMGCQGVHIGCWGVHAVPAGCLGTSTPGERMGSSEGAYGVLEALGCVGCL